LTSQLEAVRYARRPVELNARPGDVVLIVTDLDMPRDVADALFAGAHSLGHEVAVVTSSARAAHGAEPSAPVAAAMAAADVVLLATSKGAAHTAATQRAAQAGARVVFMEEVTLDMLCRGAATADYDEVGRLASVLGARWNAGSRVKVTSQFGTDLEAGIDGRRAWEMAGRAFSESWFALSGCCAFPDGEVGLAPVEGTANGTVVFDASTQTLGPLEEPVRLEIVDSMIVGIEGGWQARAMREQLEALDDPNAFYCPAEIAIGINGSAELTGLLREDKKLLGSCHIAYGANDDLGGTVAARTHVDGLIRHPTIQIDDETVVRDGVVLVAPTEDDQ
jgi:leucyl aminopeptidase (aminopeptidase T)